MNRTAIYNAMYDKRLHCESCDIKMFLRQQFTKKVGKYPYIAAAGGVTVMLCNLNSLLVPVAATFTVDRTSTSQPALTDPHTSQLVPTLALATGVIKIS